MGLLDSFKNMLGGSKSKLPADLNSPDEIKQKLDGLMSEHGDKINQVVDKVQEEVPGTVGDKEVDGLQEKLTGQSDQPNPPVQPTPPAQPTPQQ